MRETWARRIAMLTGGLVVALAVLFAYSQNPPHRPAPASAPSAVPAPPPLAVAPALVETGRGVYAGLGCARCHSIAGRGNPRSPLDGVGARLSEEEIRHWVTPSAPPAKNFQARHANIELTAAQRDALVVYLRSLK